MFKTKLIKILPFWLIGLVLLIGIEILGDFPLQTKITAPLGIQSTAQSAQDPEVLGETTSLRGDPVAGIVLLQKIQEPDVSTITAKSFIVFDLTTGETLLGNDIYEKLKIASLTKLMTGLVAYENADLNKSFIVADQDTLNIRPNLKLQVGDEIKALDIFNSMLIGSCNDAAQALADYTSTVTGQNFIKLMNDEAHNLGMVGTNFSNPMGFDSQDNYSTAADLKLLISTTQSLSAFSDLGRRESYQFTSLNGRSYSTVATNTLLKDHPDITAIKTGFTTGAGGAMATKFSLSGHDLVILVLDSQDREADTLWLKNQVSNDFR